MSIRLREETDRDIPAIHALTTAAFRDAPHASGTEADIVDALRDAGALSLSLVATDADVVVGHVAFSIATAEDGSGPWFTLGPVSVLPERQRGGIGAQLIRPGIATLRQRGAAGCILVGDPAYYRRFGFEAAPASSPGEDFAAYFMLMPLASGRPDGRSAFHAAVDEAG